MDEGRKVAAILVADIVGFSRLTAADEEATLARLRALRAELFNPGVAAHGGRVVKRTGDGAIVEFRSVVVAVRCALDVTKGLAERNAGLSPDQRIEVRTGIHLGDVVEEADGDLMGDGVNIAARLEGICAPGAISLSEDAWRQVRDKISESFVDLGEHELKNIARPTRVFALGGGAGAGRRPAPPREGGRLGNSSGRRSALSTSSRTPSMRSPIGRGRLAARRSARPPMSRARGQERATGGSGGRSSRRRSSRSWRPGRATSGSSPRRHRRSLRRAQEHWTAGRRTRRASLPVYDLNQWKAPAV